MFKDGKLKVLAMADAVSPPYGELAGMKVVWRLIQGLADRGFEMHLATVTDQPSAILRDWITRQWDEHGIVCHIRHSAQVHRLVLSRLLLTAHAASVNRHERFDLVHDFSSTPLMAWRTMVAARPGRSAAIHTVCTAGGGNRTAVRTLPRQLGALVVTRDTMAEMMRQAGYGPVRYIPLGIDLAEVRQLAGQDGSNSRQERGHDPLILFVGPLTEKKGAFVAADVFRLVAAARPTARFVVATHGLDLKGYVYREAREKFLSRCASVPPLTLLEGVQNVPALMAKADVFLYPLQEQGGTLTQPATLLEAMATSSAIVATDIAMVRSCVKHGHSALLTPAGDATRLAGSVRVLLDDAARRAELGRGAAAAVEAYDLNRAVEAYSRLYEELGRSVRDRRVRGE